MGRVWLLAQQFDEPFDPIYRRNLAVKTFDFVRDQTIVEQELNAWISIIHPNVLPLKKIGRLNYRLAAIMPLIPGTLGDQLESVGSLSERAVAHVLTQATNALNHAWQQHGILHLDLKPSNILLKDKESLQIQVADWGISRLANDSTIYSRPPVSRPSLQIEGQMTSYLAGTPLYMSPERFSGNWSLDPSADVYSLGMLAIQLLCGTLPFRFGEVDPLSEIQAGSYLKKADTMLGGSTDKLRQMIMRCIHPIPKNRTSTFENLLSDLKRLN